MNDELLKWITECCMFDCSSSILSQTTFCCFHIIENERSWTWFFSFLAYIKNSTALKLKIIRN